jgi:hypothetical protein
VREHARDVLFARAGGFGGHVVQRAQRQRVLVARGEPQRSRSQPLDEPASVLSPR